MFIQIKLALNGDENLWVEQFKKKQNWSRGVVEQF